MHVENREDNMHVDIGAQRVNSFTPYTLTSFSQTASTGYSLREKVSLQAINTHQVTNLTNQMTNRMTNHNC